MRGKFVADGSGELHSGGISVAGGCVVRGGRPERVKKNGGRKKVTQLSFCMKNPVTGKYPAAA